MSVCGVQATRECELYHSSPSHKKIYLSLSNAHSQILRNLHTRSLFSNTGTSNYEAEFLKQTGQLVTLKVLDNSGSLVDLIDDDSFALKMNLWRAPTDNDLGDTWVQLDEDVVPTHVKILAKTLKCVGFTPGGM